MAEKEYIERRYVLFFIEDHKKVADNCTEFTKDISDTVHNQIAEIVRIIPVSDVVPGCDFRDCRNELCLKCGEYARRHLGACDGCRWRDA